MPTYRNDTKNAILAKNLDGALVSVGPGETIESYDIISTMTKTSSDPGYSRTVAVTNVAFTEGEGLTQTVTLDADTRFVKIEKGQESIFLEISMFFESAENDEIFKLLDGDSSSLEIPTNGNVTDLVLVSDNPGFCKLYELR